MLLNWQDTLDNLFTLVHETGHSLHSTFTRQTQPYVYGDYPIFLAEIASTTNENILTETLLKEVKDDKTRFAILNHYWMVSRELSSVKHNLQSLNMLSMKQMHLSNLDSRLHE